MAKSFKLSVVAPDRTVFEGEIISIVVPAKRGYMGIMAEHVPTIVALNRGVLEYQDPNGSRHYISIDGGFLETSAGVAIVLAERAQRSTEIDVSRAQEDLERARRALRGEDSSMTRETATEVLERAVNQLKAARMN